MANDAIDDVSVDEFKISIANSSLKRIPNTMKFAESRSKDVAFNFDFSGIYDHHEGI
jgi:hypothetical protein